MLFLNNWYTKTLHFFETHRLVRYLFVYAFFFLSLMWMYFGVTTVSSGDDHYFHFRFAQILSQEGFFQSFRHFDVIYFSNMATGTYTVYYNFLFYLVVILFAKISPLYLGIKLYAVFIAALYATTFYGVLRWLAVRRAFIWTTALFAITGYSALARLFLSRPYVLAPAILLLILLCCFKKKYWWAGILSFVYLFWHSLTFYFPLLIGCAYWFFEYFHTKKHNWKVIFAIGTGTAVAIGVSYLLVPGFLHYVWDVVFGIYRETIIGKKVMIPEGGELYPSDFFETVNANLFLFPFFVTAALYQFAQLKRYWPERGEKPEPAKQSELVFSTTLVVLTCVFFIGTITVSRRFGDFFVLFSWALIAFSMRGILASINITSVRVRRVILASVGVSLVFFFINTAIALRSTIAGASAPSEFQHVGEWLAENTHPGEIIFYPNWSWFTQLYYYSPHNKYIIGLEPRFLYTYNPTLYWKWASISSTGYLCDTSSCPQLEQIATQVRHNKKLQPKWYKIQGDEIAQSILNDFQSQYIVSTEGAPMNDVMDNNPHFTRVYGDGGDKRYFVYKVSP